MPDLDLNLLLALDVLLEQSSVTHAATRLGLSTSAMSRTLTRLREVTGDPLLVRAGRRLVPTPRAVAMRDQVRALVWEARTVLVPQAADIDPAILEQTFTIRTSEGFLELFCASLASATARVAPHVRLRFSPKADKGAGPLREGVVDLEVGVTLDHAPEVRTRLLFRDRFVGAARKGHPLLVGEITPARYAMCRHVVASRRGLFNGPVDDALAQSGLSRQTMVVVPSFADALRVAQASDLVTLVPGACFLAEHPRIASLCAFDLPVHTPEIAVSMMWHPRMDADPAHQWLREMVLAHCTLPPQAAYG